MNNTQKIHLSPLLAQKKLLDGGNSNNGSNSLAAPSFNSNIKDIPSFNIPNRSNDRTDEDFGLPFSEVIEVLSRKAKSVYERYLISEQGRELIAKAEEYEIPYDIRTVNFLELRDQVEEFEEVIEKAAEYGINWQEFGYDMLGIEQEMIDIDQANMDYSHEACSYYLADRV
ncbi:MAG: hypothetical protein AAF673_06125 [Pseudomonadota bacterium]